MERVGLIPAAIPNWESGVTLEYAYHTAILTSRDGTEQRMALRQQPRATMRYRSLMRPERIYRHYADLTKNIDQLFTVPMRWKSEPITASTASVITVDAVPFWAIVGARVVVANETTEEASEITAINGTDLSIETTITDPTTLYAAAHGRYEDSVQVDAETSEVWTLDVQFGMEPGQIVPVTTITPGSFEGIDVFPFDPNWREAGELEFTSERETLDHDLGVVSVRNPRTYITETIRHRFSLFNAQTADEMLAFFVRQKGKRGEFWVPTDRSDMQAIATVSSGGTEIEVSSRDLGTYMADSPVYNVVRIGDQIVRVSGIALGSTGTVLTLAEALTADVTPATKISWCPLCRFAADRMEIVWVTDSVAEVVVPVRTLPNDGGA